MSKFRKLINYVELILLPAEFYSGSEGWLVERDGVVVGRLIDPKFLDIGVYGWTGVLDYDLLNFNWISSDLVFLVPRTRLPSSYGWASNIIEIDGEMLVVTKNLYYNPTVKYLKIRQNLLKAFRYCSYIK